MHTSNKKIAIIKIPMKSVLGWT